MSRLQPRIPQASAVGVCQTRPNDMWQSPTFCGTPDEFVAYGYTKDSEAGKCCEATVKYVNQIYGTCESQPNQDAHKSTKNSDSHSAQEDANIVHLITQCPWLKEQFIWGLTIMGGMAILLVVLFIIAWTK